MAKDFNQITESEFNAYRKVQHCGRFNMATECNDAALAAGLCIDTYMSIIFNYSELEKKFGAYRAEPAQTVKICRPSKANPEPQRPVREIQSAYWVVFNRKPNSPEARLRDWRLCSSLCETRGIANDLVKSLMEQASGKYGATRKERQEWKLVKLTTETLLHRAMENRKEVEVV